MSLDNEKREFYRIEDEVTMELTPVADGESSELLSNAREELPEAIQTLRQLRQLDSESQQLLRLIQDKHREVAAYLKVQNKKIDVLARAVASQLKGNFQQHRVNISGNGLKFNSQQPMVMDSVWRLRILLFPDCVGFVCLAKVVSCEPAAKGFEVALEFCDILQQDQDALVKHITQLQSEQLRKERLES